MNGAAWQHVGTADHGDVHAAHCCVVPFTDGSLPVWSRDAATSLSDNQHLCGEITQE